MKNQKHKVIIGTVIAFLIPFAATMYKLHVFLNSTQYIKGDTNGPEVSYSMGYGTEVVQGMNEHVPDLMDMLYYGGITIAAPIITYFVLKYLSET